MIGTVKQMCLPTLPGYAPPGANVLRRQQWLQPRPLFSGQIMTLQTIFVHADDLHQYGHQDHGTVPSAARRRGSRDAR